MSDETIAVVALDAADYALCQSWGCENILLDNHHELETFAYSGEKPITLEVWTSVATGVHPQEHGMASTGEQQSWDNPLLEIASRLTPYLLPKDVRVKPGFENEIDDELGALAVVPNNYRDLNDQGKTMDRLTKMGYDAPVTIRERRRD